MGCTQWIATDHRLTRGAEPLKINDTSPISSRSTYGRIEAICMYIYYIEVGIMFSQSGELLLLCRLSYLPVVLHANASHIQRIVLNTGLLHTYVNEQSCTLTELLRQYRAHVIDLQRLPLSVGDLSLSIVYSPSLPLFFAVFPFII